MSNFDLCGSLMFGHAWEQIKWPTTIDKDNKVVQTALMRYVWAVTGLICYGDLSVDRVELAPEGITAYPSTEQVHPDACVPDHLFKAFPPGFYRALEYYSEGRCPRCGRHALKNKLAVCVECAFEMEDIPPDGSLYIPTTQ